MAELVDAEVRTMLDVAYQNATEILKEQMDILHAMANALLERETLERDDVELLIARKELPPPRVVEEASESPPPLPSGDARPSGAGPVLGTPPPKPAGA